jgi:hypothetical protein
MNKIKNLIIWALIALLALSLSENIYFVDMLKMTDGEKCVTYRSAVIRMPRFIWIPVKYEAGQPVNYTWALRWQSGYQIGERKEVGPCKDNKGYDFRGTPYYPAEPPQPSPALTPAPQTEEPDTPSARVL